MPQIFQKTWGGSQFWGDVHYFRGWKIQQNVYTKHYRLLDSQNYRFATGSFETCLDALNEIKRKQQLTPMSGEVVILLHGILRSSRNFSRFKQMLKGNGYHVVNFEYPSTRVSIETSADYLQQTIASLHGVEKIHFVVHSMGGLVVRTMLRNGTDPRFSRMVMLGTPNSGAQMADLLKNWRPFQLLYGTAGQQLVTDRDGYIQQLPIPTFEFAIIAGGRGISDGFNPLIPGDDDGVVTRDCTRLPGATDSSVVHCIHSFLPGNRDVMGQTLRFLKTGRLRADGEPQPIPRE
ncbi:MAG: alpha/beta fold hydrolase [Planctomycetota bacterium]|nr:alpha/beta fold hydrolase [Planctomycetota bacterium]MDA1211210.1 alpha/beta fold hydrolase [Planctomycetota bacterium]